MKTLKNMSVRRKQMLIIVLTSAIVVSLACAAFSAYDMMFFRHNMVQEMTTTAEMMGDNTAAALDFNDPSAATEVLDGLQAQPELIGAAIYTKEGELFAKYDRAHDNIVFHPPSLAQPGHEFKNGKLILSSPILRNGEAIGAIYIESDMRELSVRLKNYAGIVGMVMAGSVLLAMVLSNFLGKLITTPILELAAVARAVAQEKSYSVRAVKSSNDEIGALIDGFNGMLGQIEERDANLERRVEERTEELQREMAERRKVEEAVRESQALYHSLVEQLPAGLFRKDATGRFVFVNSWFCRVKGVKAEEFLGKTAREINDTQAVKNEQLTVQGMSHHEQIMRNGKVIELEEEYADAHGGKQYFHVVKSPIFGPDGSVVGSQGALFDITQRKRIESILAHERELLGVLMDYSEDSIYFKDMESRFVRCSVNMAKMFGVPSVEDMIGKRDGDFFATEHAAAALADEQRIIQTGEAMLGTIEKEVWPDGRVTWALTSKMPFRNRAGQTIGTFGISKDITAMKEAEAKLKKVHGELVTASRQAGMAEVATSVLHNVGNVLNSVNVSSSLIADKLRNSKGVNFGKAMALIQEHKAELGNYLTTDPKGRQLPDYLAGLARHLEAERDEIQREVSSLVNNIIHIKEIVAMQQSYAKSSGVLESLKVTDLVEDAINMNTGAMSRHQVTVVREFKDVPPIMTEKHKVLQILVNLIRNAKYACDDSGREDKQITLRVVNGGGSIKIAVVDNGIGIPAENLTRIFNHGFTTRKEGHGFGLHSGALAAKELGGTLIAASEGHGRGATFTLELPVK